MKNKKGPIKNSKNKTHTKMKKRVVKGKYFDFGSISKGFIFLGIIILITYALFLIVAVFTYNDNIWDDAAAGQEGTFTWIIPLSFIFIFVGIIIYYLHTQFVKLSDFAKEVESGEFEAELEKEQENENKKKS